MHRGHLGRDAVDCEDDVDEGQRQHHQEEWGDLEATGSRMLRVINVHHAMQFHLIFALSNNLRPLPCWFCSTFQALNLHPHEETRLLRILVMEGQVSSHTAYQEVLAGIRFIVIIPKCLDSGVDEQKAKGQLGKETHGQQAGAKPEKRQAQEDGGRDPPEECTFDVEPFGSGIGFENQLEYEEIVDRQHVLQEISIAPAGGR
mmetsp:Transcript_29922/g.64505  ORF Transcript_29922/g.64505 Transcript_29922/m.64505 type:complete len:202 (+) Transcript_29922:394-999(+)